MSYLALHAYHAGPCPIYLVWGTFPERAKIIRTVKAQEETPARIALRERLHRELKQEEIPDWLAQLKVECDPLWTESERLLAKSERLWNESDGLEGEYAQLWYESRQLWCE